MSNFKYNIQKKMQSLYIGYEDSLLQRLSEYTWSLSFLKFLWLKFEWEEEEQ